MKKNTYAEKRKKYIKKRLKKNPPKGGELVLYGSIIILIWALGELNAAYTYIIAWFKTDMRIIEQGYITAKEYFFDVILKTPEALNAIRELAILCLSILMGIIGIVFRNRKISIPMIITAAVLSVYEVADPFWMKVTDYTRYVKLLGCALILMGSAIKIITWVVKRNRAAVKFDKTHKPKGLSAQERKAKTLIPERINTNRK
ncbi:MAG: hypothetical protein II920_04420 [Clostridia bacterium]|nr:hypothetical protein [Clostridia bacterium]